jgi:hypothetical protein
MTKPATKKQKLWQSRLEAAHASGLSLSQYAQQNNLPLKQLYAWQSRLKQMRGESATSPCAFVRVDAKPVAHTFVEINLPNGVQLRLSELTTPVLRMLMSP